MMFTPVLLLDEVRSGYICNAYCCAWQVSSVESLLLLHSQLRWDGAVISQDLSFVAPKESIAVSAFRGKIIELLLCPCVVVCLGGRNVCLVSGPQAADSLAGETRITQRKAG